jgi:hypothetical protein
METSKNVRETVIMDNDLLRKLEHINENKDLKALLDNLLPVAKTVEQEVVKLKQYNEDLIYEKEQSTQKIIDLKAQLKFSVKEYRELNEITYQTEEKMKRYERAFKEIEDDFENYGDITGDRRFVEWIRQKKEKHGI